MKKALIGAFVGAILVFAWQAVAHMLMHHHDAGYKTVPNQEAAMTAMSGFFKEDGQYRIPMHDMNAPHAEQEKWMQQNEGKPWAQVIYHTNWHFDMTTPMIRSFATAFLCVLIFIGIMGKNPGTFASIFLKSIGAGFFAFLYVWYNQHVWMEIPWAVVQGELIDCLAAWALCGLWLGMYLKKK